MTKKNPTRSKPATRNVLASALTPGGLHPKLRRMFKFGGVLSRETERGVVLVAAGLLDKVVREILESFFIEGSATDGLLSEKGGAIGDYFTRCNVAYVLGLISKAEFQRLLIVGELRNKFAHVWELATFADLPNATAKLEELSRCRSAVLPDLSESTDPRERALFEYEAVSLLSELHFRSEQTVRRERHPGRPEG